MPAHLLYIEHLFDTMTPMKNTTDHADAADPPLDLCSVDQLLDVVDRSLDRACAVNMVGLSRADMSVFVCRIQELRARTDALAAVAAYQADQAAVQLLGKTRGVPSHVALRTNAAARVVGRDRNIGDWLAFFPMFQDAALQGVLTPAHIGVLRKACNRRTETALRDYQQVFVNAARDCSFEGFCQAATYWLNLIDPDGDAPDEQADTRSTTVRRNSDGTVSGDFDLDAVGGTVVLSAIEQETQRLLTKELEAAPDGPRRTDAQRRADAFVNLISRGALRDDGTLPAPLVHLVVGQRIADDALKRYGNEPLAEGETLPDTLPLDPNHPEGRCELADGTPIHPKHLMRILDHATLRRIALSNEHTVADLSKPIRRKKSSGPLTSAQLAVLISQAASVPLESSSRNFPAHLKQALLVAARGRCANGCQCPTTWLHADHIHPHNRGGPTATWNGQILCSHCNRTKRDQITGPAYRQHRHIPLLHARIPTPQRE